MKQVRRFLWKDSWFIVLNTAVTFCGNCTAVVGSCITCRLECRLSKSPGDVVSSPPSIDVGVEVVLLNGLSASPTGWTDCKVLLFQLVTVEFGC